MGVVFHNHRAASCDRLQCHVSELSGIGSYTGAWRLGRKLDVLSEKVARHDEDQQNPPGSDELRKAPQCELHCAHGPDLLDNHPRTRVALGHLPKQVKQRRCAKEETEPKYVLKTVQEFELRMPTNIRVEVLTIVGGKVNRFNVR